MRRLLTVMLALVILVGTQSGCGRTDGGVREITVWHTLSEDTSGGKPHYWYTEWAKHFNEEHTDIHVTVLGAKSVTDIQTAIAAGETPDIFLNQWNKAPTWANNGLILDLTPYYERDKAWNYSDFMPGALGICNYNGRFYSVPNSYQTTMMFYDADILAECGWDSFPTDLDEMFQCIKDTTKAAPDGSIERLGFLPNMPWLDVVLWPAAFGIQWISEDGRTVQAEKALPVLQYINGIYDYYETEYGWTRNDINSFAGSVTVNRATCNDPVLNGEVAMRWNTENVAAVFAGLDPNGSWRMAPFPNAKGVNETMMLAGSVWEINARTKDPDAAWTVLADLTSAENMRFMSPGENGNGFFYARRSVLEYMRGTLAEKLGSAKADASVGAKVTDNLMTISDIMLNCNMQSFPCAGCVDEMITIISTNCSEVFNEGADPVVMLENANRQIQPLLDADPYTPYSS